MTSDRDEVFHLFQGMHQGVNSAADHQRLQSLLRDDVSARHLWYLSCDVEAGLAAAVSVRTRSTWNSAGRARLIAWWSAAAAIVLAVLWIGLPGPNVPQPAFARLTAADNARWSDPNTEFVLRGGELPSGRLILESGRAEFLFSSGARVAVDGPADIEPLGPRRLSLRRGTVLCQCRDERAHIIVITPQGVVTDLGTEFTVQVDDAQTTHVAVISGTVEVDSQAATRRVGEGEALAIGADHALRVETRKLEDLIGLMRFEPFRTVAVEDRVNRLTTSSFAGVFPGTWIFTRGNCARVDGRGIAGAAAVRISSLGSRYWPLISQRVAVHEAAGQIAVGSITALNPSDDPLRAGQCAIVKLVCRDAQDRELAQAECHFQNADQPCDRYVRAQVRLIVPPETATIEFQTLLNASGLTTGSVYIDEPALYLIPNMPGQDQAGPSVPK